MISAYTNFPSVGQLVTELRVEGMLRVEVDAKLFVQVLHHFPNFLLLISRMKVSKRRPGFHPKRTLGLRFHDGCKSVRVGGPGLIFIYFSYILFISRSQPITLIKRISYFQETRNSLEQPSYNQIFGLLPSLDNDIRTWGLAYGVNKENFKIMKYLTALARSCPMFKGESQTTALFWRMTPGLIPKTSGTVCGTNLVTK